MRNTSDAVRGHGGLPAGTGVPHGQEAAGAGDSTKAGIALAAGLAIAIAAFGAGLGQGRAVAAAMESIGRNPNAPTASRRR